MHSDSIFGRLLGSSTDVHVAQVQQVAQRMQQQNHYPDFVMPFLMQRAGQALVQRAVLVEEAGHLGMTVTDSDVRNELMHGPFAPVLFPGGSLSAKIATKTLCRTTSTCRARTLKHS